jgi:hypothetical protein
MRAVMSLLTVHKLFIMSAVALFLLNAVWELRKYAGGDASALLRSGVSGLAAVGLTLYLRWVWVHRRSETRRR